MDTLAIKALVVLVLGVVAGWLTEFLRRRKAQKQTVKVATELGGLLDEQRAEHTKDKLEKIEHDRLDDLAGSNADWVRKQPGGAGPPGGPSGAKPSS